MPPSATAAALQQAADGLTYPSETDVPWTAFHWPDAKGEPSPAEVQRLGRHRPNSPAVEQTIEEFFAPLVQEEDWFSDEEKDAMQKYRLLLAAVQTRLQHPKVTRIGTRKIAVYVVGIAPEGGWAGLTTTSVET